MEQDFTSNLYNELKHFQTILMSSVENMIIKKIEALTIAMQQSFQATVAQAIIQSLQNNNTMELILQPDYNSQTLNTTNNQAQVHNTNETNNTCIISANNLKIKRSNGKRITVQIISISMVQSQQQKSQTVL